MVVAAAAALAVVPLPPPAVAVVLPAPEQAHRNHTRPHPPRGPGEAKVRTRLRQSSIIKSLSQNLGMKHGAAATLSHEWAASLTGLPNFGNIGKLHVHRGGHTAQTMKRQDSVPSCRREAGACRQASEMTARTPRKERTNKQGPV